MERNINDVNREPFWQRVVGDGFLSDLTKKLIASAGEKASAAVGAKAGDAIGNKLFNRQKKKLKSPEGPPKVAPAVEENKGSELVKLLQAENEKPRSAASRTPLRSNIHEIFKRLLSDE